MLAFLRTHANATSHKHLQMHMLLHMHAHTRAHQHAQAEQYTCTALRLIASTHAFPIERWPSPLVARERPTLQLVVGIAPFACAFTTAGAPVPPPSQTVPRGMTCASPNWKDPDGGAQGASGGRAWRILC